MRVLYVAKHNSGGSDDEGAICHALRKLGHMPVTLRECDAKLAPRFQADIALTHKLDGPLDVDMPRANWFFDQVEFDDPMLCNSTERRRKFMGIMQTAARWNFATDGDWCCKKGMMHLPQGADERYLPAHASNGRNGVLFAGSVYGERRRSFYDELYAAVPDFRYERRCFQARLRMIIGETAICVAPDWPLSDRYWSNRVYTFLGMGAFLLHPWSAGLAEHYANGEEIVFYHTRTELHQLIREYKSKPKERLAIAQAGLERTRAEHTYLHRVQALMQEVQNGAI